MAILEAVHYSMTLTISIIFSDLISYIYDLQQLMSSCLLVNTLNTHEM